MAIIKAKVIQARIKKSNILEEHNYQDDGLDSASLELTRNEARNIIDSARLDAERKAAEIISSAEAKAANLLNQANAKLASLEEERSKIDDERKQAYKIGLEEAEEVKDEFLKMLSGFQHAKERTLKEAEEEIASLAILIAQKLIKSEIKRDKSSKAILTKQIRAAISKVVAGKGIVKILLAPVDMIHSKSLKNSLAKLLEEGVNLLFEEDETVEPASCIIETKGGRFDASFSTQIKVIKVALEKNLGHKIVDLDTKYQEDSEMLSTLPKSNSLSFEPSDSDLDALLSDIHEKGLFDEDAELKSKVDDEISDDDLDLDGDEDDGTDDLDDDSDEDEDEDDDDELFEDDDPGAVDEEIVIESDTDTDTETDDPFATEDDDSEGDERFPEY